MPFTLRLPVLLDQAIGKAAEERGLHKSVFIEQILREWVKSERDRKTGRDQGGDQPAPGSGPLWDDVEKDRGIMAGYFDPPA